MPKCPSSYMVLDKRPVWDTDGGIWYCVQGVVTDRPTPMYRHRPTVNQVCEPLLGSSSRNQEGAIVGVSYPTLANRVRIYREALELIVVFREYDELITLAMYRRQVTRRGGIPVDEIFFNLACDARFSQAKWMMLAERMPDRSPIRFACLRRATLGPKELPPLAAVAA